MDNLIETIKLTLSQLYGIPAYNLDPVGPLGPIWDTAYSQIEELETLITKYKKAIICQKQMTIAIKHDTDRTCQNCNKNRTNCWTSLILCFYEICTICKWHNSSYVTYYDHCIIVLLFISFAVNMFLCLCLSCISLRWKHASPVVTWFGFKWVPKSSPWPQPQQGNTTNSTSTHLKGFARCLVYAKCRVWRSISSVLAQHTAHATAWCVLEPLRHSKSNAWAGHHGKKR